MVTDINEKIEVIAVFGSDSTTMGGVGVRPVRFKWKEQDITVMDITYSWSSMDGSVKIYHFSASDGNILYELAYNSQSLNWSLEKIEAP